MIQSGNDAYEAIRTLNHATITTTIPAPVAYALLGSLRQLEHAVAQLAGQLSTGLRRSLSEFDVYDDARDPAQSVAMAAVALEETANHANRTAECAAAAQLAITWQGFRLEEDNR
jgi:GH35 family endo-1,4-beta-xylanase